MNNEEKTKKLMEMLAQSKTKLKIILSTTAIEPALVLPAKDFAFLKAKQIPNEQP